MAQLLFRYQSFQPLFKLIRYEIWHILTPLEDAGMAHQRTCETDLERIHSDQDKLGYPQSQMPLKHLSWDT